MISVFQIHFDKKSEAAMDPDFFPYSNQVRDEFFENRVIRDIYEMDASLKQGMSYLGVTSWKQLGKTHLTGKEILNYIHRDIDSRTEKDIYIYSPLQGIEPKLDHSKNPPQLHGTIYNPDIWAMHKNRFEQIHADDKLLNSSGVLPFDLFDGKWQYCNCNYWIAKPHVFDDYCKNVLVPAMNFFNRPDIMAALPKWYIHRHEQRKTTSICFTLEGLFGAFMAHRNYTFDYIAKKKIKRKYQMVKVDGYEVTNNLLDS